MVVKELIKKVEANPKLSDKQKSLCKYALADEDFTNERFMMIDLVGIIVDTKA